MSQPRTLVVGPYLLVRPLATRHLRIYAVHEPAAPDKQLAVLWQVDASEYAIPDEWRVRCLDCPEPPSPRRREAISKAFYDRDRALLWLLRHREQLHPTLEVA